MIYYKFGITAAEVNFLRASVGFRQIHPEQIEAGLLGSSLIIAAYNADNIVGMGRLIWDGGSVALICDLIIIPEYRGYSIEIKIIDRIFEFLRSKLKPASAFKSI